METTPVYVSSRVEKFIIVFLIVVSIFFVGKSLNAFKEYRFIGSGTTATNTIAVSGSGEAYAAPDIAELNFTVRSEKKTVKEAETTVTESMNKAIDYLKSSNIAEKDIKLEGNSFYPKYTYTNCTYYPCSQRQIITGYEVSRTVSIKIRTIDDASKIVDGLSDLGITELSGPTFTVDNEDQVKSDARADAISDAEAKAKELAKELGVTLVRIVNFSENGNSPYPPMYYAKDMALESAGSANQASELPPGENKYSSTVTITYEIK